MSGRRTAPRHGDRPRERPAAPRESSPIGSATIGVLALLVSAATLVWAGMTTPPTNVRPTAATGTTSIARDLTCAGGLPDSTAAIGVAGRPSAEGLTVDGAAPHHPSLRLAGTPAEVHADAAVSAKAFAVRTASAKGWYAAGTCPSPRSTWWFVGAGGSQGHHSELTISNPRKGDAIVDIEVLGPHGVVRSPGLDDVRINSGSFRTFDLSKVAPAVGDLAVRVVTSRGLVSASVSDSWSADYVENPALDWVSDQPTAARRLNIAGVPATAADATLLVANPTEEEAVVQLSLVGRNGGFAPTKHATVRVPPGVVRPVALKAVLKAHPLGLRLVSQLPISATVRVRQGTDAAYLPAVEPLAGSGVLGVPTHSGSASLDLYGAKKSAKATVDVYDSAGRRLPSASVTVRTGAAAVVSLPAHAASIVVHAPGMSGALVLGADTKAALAVLALTTTSSQARVPAVVADW